jgi:hypothetical protein
MADITKCTNGDCSLRKECWRYNAPTRQGYQSFALFKPDVMASGKVTCSMFIRDKQMKTKTFTTKEELRHHIDMNMPFAVRATRPAKTTFVNPFTSANARESCINEMVKCLIIKTDEI